MLLFAEILSVQVKSSGSSPTLQSRTVNPSSSTQYITPQSRYDALSQVTVWGDSNLIGSNIKSGVSIFGVSGSLTSADYIGYYAAITANGTNTLAIPHPLGYRSLSNTYLIYLRIAKSSGANRFKEYMHRNYSLYEVGDSYKSDSYNYNDSTGSEVTGGGSTLFVWNEDNIVFTSPDSEIVFANNVIYNFYALVKS